MKHPCDILSHHEQRHENSCIAWGLELILKMHEKIALHEYPLQNGQDPLNYDFVDKGKQTLLDYKIASKRQSFGLAEFEETAKSQSEKGFPLIFSIPNTVEIDGQIRRITYHVWIAIWAGDSLQYRSRKYGHPGLSSLRMDTVFHQCREQVAPDYQIDCLLHSGFPYISLH
jgi:hypothetical protein